MVGPKTLATAVDSSTVELTAAEGTALGCGWRPSSRGGFGPAVLSARKKTAAQLSAREKTAFCCGQQRFSAASAHAGARSQATHAALESATVRLGQRLPAASARAGVGGPAKPAAPRQGPVVSGQRSSPDAGGSTGREYAVGAEQLACFDAYVDYGAIL